MPEQRDRRARDREALELETRTYGLSGTVAILAVVVSVTDAIVLDNPRRAAWALSFVLVVAGLACFLALRNARRTLQAMDAGLDADGDNNERT